jgi:phage-related minor tail protein
MLGNIASKLLDMAMNKLITDLLGSLFGGGGGGFLSSVSGSTGNALGAAVGIGGIIPFANGGIVNQPTLALIGEGADSEAVLPIPKLNELMAINRSIGAAGSQGGNVISNINVTINNDGSANITGQQGSNLSSKITDAVRAVISSERRPGGMLFN